MDDEEFAAKQEEARVVVRRMGRAAEKLSQSTLERKMRLKLGSSGLAGAYLVRSFELVIEQNGDLMRASSQHQEMVDMIRQILLSFLSDATAETPGSPYPPGSPLKH